MQNILFFMSAPPHALLISGLPPSPTASLSPPHRHKHPQNTLKTLFLALFTPQIQIAATLTLPPLFEVGGQGSRLSADGACSQTKQINTHTHRVSCGMSPPRGRLGNGLPPHWVTQHHMLLVAPMGGQNLHCPCGQWSATSCLSV